MITFSESCIRCGTCARICPTHHLFFKPEEGPVVRENLPCLECMHCAAACPKKAIHFSHVPAYEEYPEMPEDETLRLIMTRRSNRHYKKVAPPAEDINWALDLAQWAPSGKNLHEVRWIVLHGADRCNAFYNKLVDTCAEVNILPELVNQRKKGNPDSVTCGCSALIFALMPDKNFNGDTDAIIATTTLELLLRKCDIGSCWGGYVTWLSKNLKQLQEYLHIPAGYHVACSLLCGYPENEAYPNIPWRPKADVTWL